MNNLFDSTRRTFIKGVFGLGAVLASGAAFETKKIVRMEKLTKPGEYFRFEYGPFDPIRLLPADGPYTVDIGLDTAKRAEIFKDMITTARKRLTEAEYVSDVDGMYRVMIASDSTIESAAVLLGTIRIDDLDLRKRICHIERNHPVFEGWRKDHIAKLSDPDVRKTHAAFINGSAFNEYNFKSSDFPASVPWFKEGENA